MKKVVIIFSELLSKRIVKKYSSHVLGITIIEFAEYPITGDFVLLNECDEDGKILIDSPLCAFKVISRRLTAGSNDVYIEVDNGIRNA